MQAYFLQLSFANNEGNQCISFNHGYTLIMVIQRTPRLVNILMKNTRQEMLSFGYRFRSRPN